jgi:hypothetical protein
MANELPQVEDGLEGLIYQLFPLAPCGLHRASAELETQPGLCLRVSQRHSRLVKRTHGIDYRNNKAERSI